MQIGIDSFVATLADPVSGRLMDPTERVKNLLEEVEMADRVHLDVFGIGEHHREEFLDSAPLFCWRQRRHEQNRFGWRVPSRS